MSRIEITNKIDIYEKNGEDLEMTERLKIIIKSHWNDYDRVVLKIGRNEYTVIADDIIKAVKNATNV